MGEIVGNDVDRHQADAQADRATTTDDFSTDVEGVKADGFKSLGKERFPVFNVDKDNFYQNMAHGRKRLRFKSGSSAQRYMQGTKYNRPFFISYKHDNGETWTRRIK